MKRELYSSRVIVVNFSILVLIIEKWQNISKEAEDLNNYGKIGQNKHL